MTGSAAATDGDGDGSAWAATVADAAGAATDAAAGAFTTAAVFTESLEGLLLDAEVGSAGAGSSLPVTLDLREEPVLVWAVTVALSSASVFDAVDELDVEAGGDGDGDD
jgi:hypothetical protein